MKTRSKLFWMFVILAIIYAAVNLIAAPPRSTLQHYHISTAAAHELNLTVILPVLVVWFLGLYGYQRLHTYALSIGRGKDGDGVSQLSRGVFFLALWLPVSSTVSAILNWIAQGHHALVPAATIISGYLGLLPPLFAFWFISRGARKLSELVKQRPSWVATNIMAVLLVLVGVFYTYVVAEAHAKLGSIYHMSVALVLLTIVVPYIFSWYLGLHAAYELHLYTLKVKGLIYKRSWNFVAIGVSWLILFSVVLQYITVVTAKFANVSLGGILALIYGIIVVLAIGYIFIARGTKQLTRIEEV